MIKQYKLQVKNNYSEKFVSYWGHLFYGILMQQIDTEYAERLHENGLKPISQSIVPIRGTNEAIWYINLFGDEAIQQFSPILEQKDSFFMEHRQREIQVVKRESYCILNEKEFMQEASETYHENRFVLFFDTPTSFKSENEYMLFPSIKHIVNSLINKWNAYSNLCYFEDEDAVRLLLMGLKIEGYRLQSSYYHMKGKKLPGFIGEVTIYARLSPPMMELWKVLLYFLEFSGVGIKTSLGMGKVTVKEKDTRVVRKGSNHKNSE